MIENEVEPNMPEHRRLTKVELQKRRDSRRLQKEKKQAEKRAKSGRRFENIGIVAGTTPRDVTAQDDIRQSLRHIKAADCQLKRDLRKMGKTTSDKPGEYDTVPEKGGFNDWARSWWKQAVPDHPSAQRSNPRMKLGAGKRDEFRTTRARQLGGEYIRMN